MNSTVLYFKRFSPTKRYRSKFNVIVNFPLDCLNLNIYSTDNIFFMRSNHSDTDHSSHCTDYCKLPYTGIWNEYNDSSIWPISSKSLPSGEVYALLYEQNEFRSQLQLIGGLNVSPQISRGKCDPHRRNPDNN